ncbi:MULTISPECIES: hypothetical protein [Myroides]|uniref:Uncharacterized protein n=1 Tax=Myroides albus TaxID=2562892 RepID=A0A6I3LHK5_9FLAO|nr:MULTISPECIES: hypothetical protein [Myroides]MTG97066.1 hypothetical protein [Myroides albus]MVX36025.1 hypothetical protein [Myroides sp. LoEW2-1]UVD78511.1 hypothetical protein NWE55_10250 [Myroides albus]
MRFVTTVLFLLFSVYSFGQDTLRPKLNLSEGIIKNSSFLIRDVFDYNYTLLENTLYKANKYQSSHYKTSKFGDISNVDLTIPNSPILFFKEEQSIIVLNRLLAQLDIIDFNVKFPSMDIAYIAHSAGRKLWMVDLANDGFVRLYNMNSYERHTIYNLEETNFVSYYSTLTNLYWLNTSNEIKGIDVKGQVTLNYKSEDPIDKWQMVDNNKIIYSSNNKLYFVDIVKSKKYFIDLKEKSILGFFYNTQKLSIFTDEKLNNYLLKLP